MFEFQPPTDGGGCHTMRGGADSRELGFCPLVGVVNVWKDFRPGDMDLSSPGGAGQNIMP